MDKRTPAHRVSRNATVGELFEEARTNGSLDLEEVGREELVMMPVFMLVHSYR